MTKIDQLAGPHVLRLSLTAMAAAGTDSTANRGVIAPFNCTIVSAKWIPTAAVTANGTNYSTVSVINKGAAGAGTALPVTRSYAATNSVADVPEAMTLSSTAADLAVTAGDVLKPQAIHTASGVVVPDGVIELTVKVR